MKLMQEEKERLAKLVHVKSETNKRQGTRIIVETSNGDELQFFYVESGTFQGWNKE